MGSSFSCYKGKSKEQKVTEGGSISRPVEKPKPALKVVAYEAVGPNGYEEVQDLGSNGGGEFTKLLRNKKTGEIVSAKFVGTSTREGVPRGIEREIVNHRSLTHPNIVRFYEVLIYDDTLGIVSEYPNGGCLSDSINEHGPVTEPQAKTLFLQLLSGMQHCHERKIWHRDLRVENFLLDESNGEPQLKIAGFGYSKSAVYDSDPVTKGLKAPLNTPPELLIGSGNQHAAYDGSKVDIWSSGIILFVMLTGRQPFEDPEHPAVMSRAVMNRIVQCSYKFPLDIQLSRECKDFIARILVATPMNRPTIAEMRQMPWLTGVKGPEESARLVESKQSTTDIAEVVERARRRKEGRSANGNRVAGSPNPIRQTAKNNQQGAASRHRQSPHQTNPRVVDGIAEVSNTAPI